MAMKRLVLAAKAGGASFEQVAVEFGLPLGTVKTWWSRHRGELGKFQVSSLKLTDETPVSVEGKGVHETGPGWHRGLMACHMPGRKDSKQLTFSMFKRGMWPPEMWKVPGHLVGGELLMMLQERACAGLAGKKGKTGN